MTPEQEKQLAALADRQEILDCIHRYSRGVDRFDRDMVLSVYHPDAVDDHGEFCGTREAFVDWAFGYHAEHQISHHHMVFNHSCELDGDTAHTETYWLFFGENKVKPNTLAIGRYLDRFEKRDGRWAIADRVCISEVVNDLSQTDMPKEYWALMTANGESSRAKTDKSYERPLRGRKS